MSITDRRPETGAPHADARVPAPRVLLVDRGDALVAPLSHAMDAHVDVVDQIDAELTRAERLLVAALTFRPDRRLWAERFFKSNLAVTLRSRRAGRALAEVEAPYDVLLQTHALFESADDRTVLYVDCTHRQSMAQWPDWNPLSGRALARWLGRERRQYQAAAHVFAFSEETRASLVEAYGVAPERVSVVGAGVNFERFPDARERHDGPPTLLFVGNDFVRKGGPELLEAFALLRRRVPDARLRIVGAPYPMAAQDGVEQLGRITDRALMSRLYAEADVFCLPAHFDPFPNVLLEAMAHGLPCVVTPTCGVPEMVVDGVTAVTVPDGPRLAHDLAGALERLIQDPETRARMGRHGRRRVQEQFLWSHVIDRMSPVLRRLADAPPGTGTDRTAMSRTTTNRTTTGTTTNGTTDHRRSTS